MQFDFSTRASVFPTQTLTLDTIFYINGDATYATPHKALTGEKCYLLCTLRGTGVVEIDGQTTLAQANTALFFQPKKHLSYHCQRDVWEFWWYECTGPHDFPLGLYQPFTSSGFLLGLFAQTLHYAKEDQWQVSTQLFWGLTAVLLHSATQTHPLTHRKRLAQDLEQHIRDNLSTITVAQLADSFSMSTRTLHNTFVSLLGCSPKGFITKIRMDQARQLLSNTALSLEEIALYLGYANPYQFSKAFKTHCAIPPSQYRTFGPL